MPHCSSIAGRTNLREARKKVHNVLSLHTSLRGMSSSTAMSISYVLTQPDGKYNIPQNILIHALDEDSLLSLLSARPLRY